MIRTTLCYLGQNLIKEENMDPKVHREVAKFLFLVVGSIYFIAAFAEEKNKPICSAVAIILCVLTAAVWFPVEKIPSLILAALALLCFLNLAFPKKHPPIVG